MEQTDSLLEVTNYLVNSLRESTLGFADVFYGDEELIPRTPCAAVVPSTSSIEPTGTGQRILNTFVNFVLIYHARYGSAQAVRAECLAKAEETKAYIHSNGRMGGLVTNAYVREMEPGYLRLNTTLMMATRITIVSTSRTFLQMGNG